MQQTSTLQLLISKQDNSLESQIRNALTKEVEDKYISQLKSGVLPIKDVLNSIKDIMINSSETLIKSLFESSEDIPKGTISKKDHAEMRKIINAEFKEKFGTREKLIPFVKELASGYYLPLLEQKKKFRSQILDFFNDPELSISINKKETEKLVKIYEPLYELIKYKDKYVKALVGIAKRKGLEYALSTDVKKNTLQKVYGSKANYIKVNKSAKLEKSGDKVLKMFMNTIKPVAKPKTDEEISRKIAYDALNSMIKGSVKLSEKYGSLLGSTIKQDAKEIFG